MGVTGLYGCTCHQFRSWKDLDFYCKQKFKPDDIVKHRHTGKFALILEKSEGRFYWINRFPCKVERDKCTEHVSLLIPYSKFSAADKKKVEAEMIDIVNDMNTKKANKAIQNKKSAVTGKSAAKGKKVPVKAKKELFEVLIRIPWDQHKIVMDYGETKKGYREVPTFNGSLKKLIPEFENLQRNYRKLQEDLAEKERKHQVISGILLRFRNSLQDVLSPAPTLNSRNNYELPFEKQPEDDLPGIAGAYGRSEAGRKLRGETKSCPSCGKMGLSKYAEECPQCGEVLDEDDVD